MGLEPAADCADGYESPGQESEAAEGIMMILASLVPLVPQLSQPGGPISTQY
jgi:hypothetical protein